MFWGVPDFQGAYHKLSVSISHSGLFKIVDSLLLVQVKHRGFWVFTGFYYKNKEFARVKRVNKDSKINTTINKNKNSKILLKLNGK